MPVQRHPPRHAAGHRSPPSAAGWDTQLRESLRRIGNRIRLSKVPPVGLIRTNKEALVTALRMLIAISGMTMLFCRAPIAQADDLRFNVCMGNGGGPSCAGGANVTLSCAQYRAIGGGGPETPPALGARLCNYYDRDGTRRQFPFNVAHIYSRGGGECGWTLFTVTCFTSEAPQ